MMMAVYSDMNFVLPPLVEMVEHVKNMSMPYSLFFTCVGGRVGLNC